MDSLESILGFHRSLKIWTLFSTPRAADEAEPVIIAHKKHRSITEKGILEFLRGVSLKYFQN
jgi:hypothetical protein